ncbi:D-glycero-alpha-D-manno-heptose-1,7-bisphosphate 7-phosphatase [Tautonia marina]|uniref:D-glycero-alpha-D-manno-heptose-1,7-bisphosphate 7-phosphatase n=1 Tax=Tautonia marina TaxID=2653855 RepID=UPI001260801F|nr:HAD family hydrolase [Tautonia marina]
MSTRRAVFLDKDGTVIENVPYNVDPSLIQLCEGAAEGLRLLAEAGYLLVVVSNQSGVARGYFPESAIGPVEARLRELLAEQGVALDGFRYCPHHPDGSVTAYAIACECRKPAPGMLSEAARTLDIELSRSWMVGDIADDVEAGRRAGCRTVLIVRTEDELPSPPPDVIAGNLAEAARRILRADTATDLTHRV